MGLELRLKCLGENVAGRGLCDLLGVSGGVIPFPLDPDSADLDKSSRKPSLLFTQITPTRNLNNLNSTYVCPSCLDNLGLNLALPLSFFSLLGTLGGSPKFSPNTNGLDEHNSSDLHLIVDELLGPEKVKSVLLDLG